VNERRVALVTGASRGIGRAAALDLAAAGFDVAIAARTARDGEGRLDTDPSRAVPGGLDSVAGEIEAAGAAALPIVMDLLDRSSVEAALTATIERFGRLDVLVNNAVYQGPGTNVLVADLAEDDLDRILEGNVKAQLALTRAALPYLLEHGGTVVNMVSATAFNDPPAPAGQGGWGLGYAMSKAAFGRVAPILHVEYADRGLRIFSVDPGFVITEAMRARGTVDEYERHFVGATPEVIGKAIAWLATSPEADELRGKVVYAQREARRRQL
jgi:NAD(P)-dependent dehydrogenase (short-subunit alcohol dehydrogenase family)